jgi:lipid A disaccharide synthetase
MFNKKEEISVKSREERFKVVAGRRVQEILNKMRLLRNCANKMNYNYTEEQVSKIFKTIDEEWRNVKSEFNKHKTKHEEFKL